MYGNVSKTHVSRVSCGKIPDQIQNAKVISSNANGYLLDDLYAIIAYTFYVQLTQRRKTAVRFFASVALGRLGVIGIFYYVLNIVTSLINKNSYPGIYKS